MKTTRSSDYFASFPVCDWDPIGHSVSEKGTSFAIWSPEAKAVQVRIYEEGVGGHSIASFDMEKGANGDWHLHLPVKLFNKFYTFRVKHRSRWLKETPGPAAKAVGINGKRAAIVDMRSTNPPAWEEDQRPFCAHATDAVIYEMHHRDFSAHQSSGIRYKGKFLALTEEGTCNRCGAPTGIDHLKELGITHVHILPSFDFCSIDESRPDLKQYNWGYDPQNYNAPEGSYSTDAFNPASRIREMKQMVKALHDAGIGVIMDVVYNHTFSIADSPFSLSAPGYFYRKIANGRYSNASGCGNETASERAMMRSYMISSLKYWVKEYHIDGFRFDLMAIHDIDTMNAISQELKRMNPSILLYGEGWTAGFSPLPQGQRASEENIGKMPGIAVFYDGLRDSLKGDWYDPHARGFASGKPGKEKGVKTGIVACTPHEQLLKEGGCIATIANGASQIVQYVSCHDNLCLADKVRESMPGHSEEILQRIAKLAQTVIFTSQGIPFMFAGDEIFRDRKGDANAYKSPEEINAIDWDLKTKNQDFFKYHCELIKLRKTHPAFRMVLAKDISKHLVFEDVEQPCVISYRLENNANGDDWKEIRLIFNGGLRSYSAQVPHMKWKVIARGGNLRADGLCYAKGGRMKVEPLSALILALE